MRIVAPVMQEIVLDDVCADCGESRKYRDRATRRANESQFSDGRVFEREIRIHPSPAT